MKVHKLVQGSPEWLAFRLHHFGASEAAAMLGICPNTKRNELLHMKKTLSAKEFSDFVQKKILDRGHEVETLARSIIEVEMGEDLYPITGSDGEMSASCDGLTIDGWVAWEHKQWNDSLAEMVKNGSVPDYHMAQCQQVLMITEAERLIFTVSDGTPNKMVSTEVLPDKEWFDRIVKGWKQFADDLAEYEPVETVEKPVGEMIEGLPALMIEITGEVKSSNLGKYRELAFKKFSEINRNLVTDQQFADAEQAVKWCHSIENRIEAAKQHALSQTASIDELFRVLKEITDKARTTRLALDKLVVARKHEIRDDIVMDGKKALSAHIEALNKRLGKNYMPTMPADFGGVVKNKRTIESLQNAVDTELARAKIQANEVADAIQASLSLVQAVDAAYRGLFSDESTLVLKPAETVGLIINQRIAIHKASIEAEAEKARARIADQERQRAEQQVEAEKAKKPETVELKPAKETAQVFHLIANNAASEVAEVLGACDENTPPPALSIVSLVSRDYGVDFELALEWLIGMAFEFQQIKEKQ